MWDIPFLDKTVSVLRMHDVTPVWDNLERVLLCCDEVAYETYGVDVLMQVAQWEMHPVIAAGFEVLDGDGDPISAYVRSLPVPHSVRTVLQSIQQEHSDRFLGQTELEAIYAVLCTELESATMETILKELYEKAYGIREKLVTDWYSRLELAPPYLILPVANENQRHWRST
jgi:hypothetical protein